jgi:hypothetical protein
MDQRPGGFRPAVVAATADSSASRPGEPSPFADDIAADIDAKLAELDDLAVAEQVALFAEVHERLTSALTATSGQAESEQRPQSRGR